MPIKKKDKKEKDWLNEDFSGKLAVDVFQKGNNIVIKSTIAGVKPDDVEVFIDNDMLTIRGKRTNDIEINKKDYFYKECYYGGFSRSIILPVDVKTDQIDASIKNGILTVTLPKAEKIRKITVRTKRK